MKEIKMFPIFLLGLLFIGCNNNDDGPTLTEEPQTEEPVAEESVQLNSEVNDFIWKGLNYWYFWQNDVTDLADSKDDDTNAYYTYLNNYNSSKDLFDDLIYTQADDFSWYIEDVDEQLNSFRGITKSYGLNLGYLLRVSDTSDDVIIYVTYVTPDSPADQAGIKRGDFIYKVDGISMTINNYDVVNNIFRNENVSIGLATVENGSVVPQGNDIALSAVELTTNPIHHAEVLEVSGTKIGYLMYTGFKATFHSELNAVFGDFKSQGITELVLDLRYNGGGSILSSALLASMIYGEAGAEQDIFATLRYNNKRNAENGVSYPFFEDVFLYDKTSSAYLGSEPMNRLNGITTLYVLASERTASASEMIINGLLPYINVVIIGEKTVGKNEGSITVVDSPGTGDSPYSDLDNRNPNHTIGMQPIVLQVYNSNNSSDYADGFEPDVTVVESQFASNLLPFGDPNEVMLSAALDLIVGSSAKGEVFEKLPENFKLKAELQRPKFANEMYIGPNEEIHLQ